MTYFSKQSKFRIRSELVDLFFPPLCLHCQKMVEKKGAIFCDECSFFFEPIDVASRCPYCFLESAQKVPCRSCRENKRWHFKMAATLETKAPVMTFIQSVQRMPFLAKLAASLMVVQFNELNWPLPDAIMIFPRSLKGIIFNGKGADYLIAKEFAKLLQLPLKRKARDQIVLVIAESLDYEKDSSKMELIMNQCPKKAYFLALGHVDVAKEGHSLVNT